MQASSPSLDFPRIKVLALGDAGVGKSCLIKRYCEGRFVAKYVPTIGIDYGVKKVEVKSAVLKQHQERAGVTASSSLASSPTPAAVRVNFWDVAGGEEALEIRNEFYTATQGILFVFDVRDAESFMHLNQWYDEVAAYVNVSGERERRTSTTTTTAAGKAVGEVTGQWPVLILCGNKVDDVISSFDPTQGSSSTQKGKGIDRVVSAAQAQEWADAHGCLAYFDISASSDLNVSTSMETLFYAIMARFM